MAIAIKMASPAARAKHTNCLSALVPQCLLLLAGLASAGEVQFTAKPTATKAGEGAKIAFTVSAPTDVEVAVLDSKGGVVRHLAAGVLGGQKDPPAPLVKGLAQTIEWDGKDDFGRLPPSTIHPPPFKVRVRAGTGVRFDRFIGAESCNFGAIDGVVADDEGNVYLKGFGGEANQSAMCVRVFDSEGRYLREVLPFQIGRAHV